MSKKAFIMVGRSGCGKGTQANLLSEYLLKSAQDDESNIPSVLYVQSGNEFRDFVQRPNYTAKLSKIINDTGGLQPEFLAVYMWTNILIREYNGNEHLIFDGMPRKVHEAGVLHSIFDFYKLPKPQVIYINVSADWATRHLLVRGRHDDNEQDINNRLKWFDDEVLPTVDFYRKNKYYYFCVIKGEQSVEAVRKEIIAKVFNK
jgi:adenylate kinase family enzyme